MRNLANNPQYDEIVERLKGRLGAWMKQQGDSGIETEMQAHKRQPKRNTNARKKRT